MKKNVNFPTITLASSYWSILHVLNAWAPGEENQRDWKSNIFFKHCQWELYVYSHIIEIEFNQKHKSGWYKRTISRIKT